MDDEEIVEQKDEQKESKVSQMRDAYDTAKDLKKLQEARTAQNAKVATNAAKAASSSGTAAGASGIAVAAVEVIAIIAIIVLIILIVVGIATFILAGMGLIWGGISEVAEGVADWWKSITSGEESIVHPETIQDTMNYLHSMDYDLYGYGFVTRPDSSMDTASGWSITPNNNPNENPDATDEERSSQGAISVEGAEDANGNGTTIGSRYQQLSNEGDAMDNTFRYLQVYAFSDNYSHLIKNNNKNFATAVSKWTNPITFFKGIFASDQAGSWGSGLLSVYYEKVDDSGEPQVGVRGNDVDNVQSAVAGTVNSIANWITNVTGVTDDDNTDYYNAAHVKTSNGKLVVSSGAANNIKFRYNLDGWVGRYGMPLEFLLATHVATMAPDLSYKLATSFDTDVEILLRKSDDSSIDAGVVQKSKETITTTTNLKTTDEISVSGMSQEDIDKSQIVIRKEDLDEALRSQGKNPSDEDIFFHLSRQNVMGMFRDTILESPESCLGTEGDVYTSVHFTNNSSQDLASTGNTDYISENHSVQLTSDDVILNETDRSKIESDDPADYHVLDDITNIRQTIYALAVKGLNDVLGAVDDEGNSLNLIKQENGLIEIDMEKYELNGANGYDDSQAGIILGDANKNYSYFNIDDSAMYFTDVPPISGENPVIGEITGVGSYSIQEHMKKKIYEEISSKELVDLEQIKKDSFDESDQPNRPHNYSEDKNYSMYVINEYNDDHLGAKENVIPAMERGKLFVGEVDDFNSTWDKDFIISILWGGQEGYDPNAFVITDRFNPGKGQTFTSSYDLTIGLEDQNGSAGMSHYTSERSPWVWKNGFNDYENCLNYYGAKNPANNWNWSSNNYYHYKMNEVTTRGNDDNYYYPNLTEDEFNQKKDKLFKWVSREKYDEIQSFATALIYGGDGTFSTYDNVDFINRKEFYKHKTVEYEAYKPVLKDKTSEWNFSFVNVSEDPDDNGNGGCHTFVNISISTEKPKDDTYKQVNLSELDDDKYELNYYNRDIGSVYVEVTARKISDEELEKGTSISEDKRCSSKAKDNSATQCCNICYNYVKELYKTLKSMTELKMTTYVPYVNRVTDHWYRNVYFTPKALEDYNNTYVNNFNTGKDEDEKIASEENIIAVDEDYALKTGERWTKYEMDDNDDYKLYVINEDTGKIDTSMLLTKANNGAYVLDEDGVTYRKAKNGETGEYNVTGDPGDTFRVAKRAIDLTSVSDKISNWSGAYSDNPTKISTGWEILDPDNEDLENMDPQMKKILTEYKDITVVSSQKYESVEQVEDGIRGETNAKVKKIFLDDYYIYDGSTLRASWIQNAKRKANSDDPKDLSEDTEIAASYGTEGLKGDQLKTTIDQISGKINITRDSLNAFSILKNMKTLDAEYIYHDFKELIVELNYFDKEDLLENAQQVMMFPVAGNDSSNWPVGGVDKYPKYYGTLLHSKADYEVLVNDLEVEKQQAQLDLSNTASSSAVADEEYQRTGEGSDKKYHKDTFFETAEACWLHVVDDKNYSYSNEIGTIPATIISDMNDLTFVRWVLYEYGYDNFKNSGTSYDFYSVSNHPEDDYKFEVNSYNAGEDFRDKLKKGDIVSIGQFTGVNNGGHLFIVCGVEKDDDGELKINAYDCSKAINWTMSNRVSGVDVTNLVKNNVLGARVIRVDKDPVQYKEVGFEDSQPVVAPVSGEVIEYGTVTRHNKEWENDEGDNNDDEVGYIKIRILDNTDTAFIDHHDMPDGDGDSASTFLRSNYTDEELDKLGYDYFEEEYSNAGIAGNILYIDGFDISEVLEKGAAGYSGGSGSTVTRPSSTSNNNNNNNNNNPYGQLGDTEIGKLKNYVEKYALNRYSTQYQIPSLSNKKTEFGIKVKEEAKKKAAFAVERNGKLYIKEGAVIGYTYGSGHSRHRDIKYLDDSNNVQTLTDQGSVGNYLRIILRDLHDEVVENVEEYMELGDNTLKTKITEQFMYWMAFTSEGALVPQEDMDRYNALSTDEEKEKFVFENYASEDEGDGMGNSGPFGLTYCDDGIAAGIGYADFHAHQAAGKVPFTEAEDVFAAVLEFEREEVYDGLINADPALLNRTSDYMFLALVDLSHAGPVMLQDQIDLFKAQGYLTRADFQHNWGTATQFQGGLEGRAIRRGILALDEFYAAGNKEGLYEVIWLTKTPWSDYLQKHDRHGNIFGGDAINLVEYHTRDGQFDAVY